MHEDQGVCGPFAGCVLGTGKFCCLCQGLWTMCFPERRTTLKMLADAGLPGDRRGWSISKYTAESLALNPDNDVSWDGNV